MRKYPHKKANQDLTTKELWKIIRNKQDLIEKNQEKSIKNAKDFLARNNRSLVIINWSLVRKNQEKIFVSYI